MTIKVA